ATHRRRRPGERGTEALAARRGTALAAVADGAELPADAHRVARDDGDPAVSRPDRSSPAGAAYLDLQNQARRTRRPTQELLQLYVLEGFLARLAASGVRE